MPGHSPALKAKYARENPEGFPPDNVLSIDPNKFVFAFERRPMNQEFHTYAKELF